MCYTCCGKKYQDRRHLAIHVKSFHKEMNDVEKERYIVDLIYGKDVVNKAIQDYIDESVCADDLKKSVNIVNLLTLLKIKRTSSEEKKTKRYKLKFESSMLDKYGVKNPSQLEEVKNKKIETYVKTFGSYENYKKIRKENRLNGYLEFLKDDNLVLLKQEKAENTCLEKYGHKNFGSGKEAKQKSINSRKKLIESWDYVERLERTSKAREALSEKYKDCTGYVSSIEKRIRMCLTDLEIDFKSNAFLWQYNYDMIFNDSKFIIEVQGDYWHANPMKYKADDLIKEGFTALDVWEKDKRKKIKAEENGFCLISIWESDIVSKPTHEELKNFVKHLLLENGYVF